MAAWIESCLPLITLLGPHRGYKPLRHTVYSHMNSKADSGCKFVLHISLLSKDAPNSQDLRERRL